jgi:CRP-like cAMP-binding protein
MGEEFKRFIESRVTLEAGAWEELRDALTYKEIPKGSHFLNQGETCKQIGFIIQGYVRLYFILDGEEITKDFNFENSFCGSFASFSLQQPSRFNIIAMEPLKLYCFGRDTLYRLFDKYPGLQKLGRLNMENMFIHKELRESSFLLDTAEQRYHNLLKQQPGIAQKVPLKYIASYLGITAETLSRIRKNEMRNPEHS